MNPKAPHTVPIHLAPEEFSQPDLIAIGLVEDVIVRAGYEEAAVFLHVRYSADNVLKLVTAYPLTEVQRCSIAPDTLVSVGIFCADDRILGPTDCRILGVRALPSAA